MKTSVAKKLRDRVLAAFLAIAVMLSYVLPTSITASAATDRYVDGTGLVDVTGSNLQLQDEYGNWVNVYDGGTTNFGKTGVQFQFNWTLDQDFVDKLVSGEISVPVTLEVDLSDQLHDINITTKDEHSVSNGKGLTGSYRFDGQKVYITINTIGKDDEQSGNTQHYGGGGLVTGELEINEEEIPSNGEVEVQFFDKTYKAVYTPKTGKMYVEKSFSKAHYDPAEDAFYADFTVNVGSWTEGLEDITLTDTFKSGDDCFYSDNVMHNVTVTMPDGTAYPLGDKKSGEKFELGDDVRLSQGEHATVTYSIKIDPEKQGNYEDRVNNVETTADEDSKSAKGSANANAALPTVDKSGSMAEGSDTIKWTIRVYLNILGSEGVPDDRQTFTVTDTPDGNIKDALAKVEGVKDNGNGTYEIPIELFDDKGNGVFEYTYETPLDESVLSSETDTRVTNHVTVEFPKIVNDKYTVGKDGELTVKGVGVGEIDKELVEMLSGGRISWKVDVTLPDADMAKLKLTDTTDNWNSKYLKHRVILDTLKINGEPYSQACKEREWYGDSDPYCNVYETGMEFELSPEFLAKHKGETVTITYQTQAVDASGNKITNIDPKMYIYNKAQFDLELSGETTPIVKYDEYEKVPQFDISKRVEYEWQFHDIFDLTDLAYPLLWSIRIDGLNSIEDTLKVGDTFTIVDTLPKYFAVDQYVWGAASDTYGNASYGQAGKDITAVQEKGSRQVVFTVTVSEEMLAKLKETAADGKWHLCLAYSTYVPEDHEQEAQMEYYRPNENVQVTNTADISFNNESVASDVTAKQNIVIENPKILNKSLLTEAVETEVVDGEIKYFVTYEVKINENETVIGDVDENGEPLLKELEAVDNLGYGLTFGKVTNDGIDDEHIRVSKNRQKVTFILENKKAYDIVYKVYIDRADFNEKVTDADQRFSNVISLSGGNNATAKNTVRMNSGTYRSNFFIYADSNAKYLTVKGTKMWENMDGNATPKEITLKLTKRNSTTNDVVGDPIEYKIGTGDDCDYNCIVDGDTWTFTIPKLVTYDGTNFYKYDIEEIAINGYTVAYEGTRTDLTNDSADENEIIKVVPLTITNTRNEEFKPETVDISINKVWVGGKNDRPESVEVTLNGTDGYSEKYTLNADNGWAVTVEDLPKYDSEGNEIEYSVTEAAVDHYNSVVTNVGDDFTVTNTYVVENTEIKVTKVWEGDLEKYGLDKKEVTVHLYQNGTEYGGPLKLNKDNDWTDSFKALPKTDNDGNEYVYTVKEDVPQHFTADTKQTGNTFTITNTVDRERFKTSLTVTKKWAENIGYYDLDKQPVTVYLTENGKKTETSIVLNDDNKWTYTFADLLKYDADGEEIKYSVEEVSIEGFNSTVTTDDDGNVTITNTVDYSKFKTSVSGVKTWSDDNDKLGLRPDSVTIELYANNIKVGTCTTDGAHDWKYSFDDLDTKDPLTDKTIVYTVKEADVEYYSATVDGYNITNTLDTAKATVRKLDDESMPVKGAHLQLFDKDNNKIADWTTNGTDEEIDVVVGMSYRLHEESAPEGYTKADDITFVAKDGENLWTMTDKKKEQTSSEQTQPTPVETPTKTPTNTPTNTPTKTPTNTPTNTPTKTPTNTPTNTPTKTPTNTPTNTPTKTPTNTPTNTPTKTPTNTPTNTPTKTPTNTPTNTPTKTPTNTPTNTPTGTSQTNPKPEEPKPTKVQISKKDITGGKELAGAKLKVVDKDGNTIKEWTSTDKPTYFENVFKAGETYTLIEETAPDGYVKAEEVEFTVSEDGSIDVVEMLDDTTKVQISKQDLTTGKELAGAKLKVVDKDGNTIKEWTSTDKPTYFENVFKAGETYTLIEETAPDGYVVAEEVKFTVSSDGSIDKVVMKDDVTKVSISKKDITGDGELAGAKLKVVDKDGNTIKEWTSTDKPTYFENVFKAGETYTLIEETAPDGYVAAEEVEFTVSEDGSIDVVEMFDDTTKVQISKQDLTTGKELAGAKLKVVDKDGNVIDEWTSTDKPTYFENVFKAGETYTLIEETAPDGYVVAEEVKFTVSSDGSIDKVVMKDDVTKVSISKKDITGDGELAGAKLKVLDKDGNVIDEWTSTDKPHEINGKLVAGQTYILHEEVAPDGYKVASDIEFVVNADGTVTKVTMIDEAKNGTGLDGDTNDKDSGVAQGGGSNDKDKNTGTNDKSPVTGDSSNVTLALAVMALGMVLVANRKRRNH